MVYLITGPTHVGKTLLAQKLLEKYKIPYLSIDHLKMGLIRTKKTNLTPYDDEELTGYLWPIIREIINTVIENKQNLIIEGCYIPQNWRESFNEEYLKDISFICLAFEEEYINKNFNIIMKHNSEIESRIVDELKIVELISDNKKTIESFERAKEVVYKIGDNYEEELDRIIKESACTQNSFFDKKGTYLI